MSIDMNIKKLGFGLMRLPMVGGEVDIAQTEQMVDLFLDKGFTYFDTAYGYIGGKSEEAIGQTLVRRYPRERFQLATKLPAFTAPGAQAARDMLHTSLERTGVDYFDFYLLHNLGGSRTAKFDEYGMWDFVARQKAEGRIRHIGFSAHTTADRLDEILRAHPEVEFVQLQINYSDWDSGIIQSRACYEVARRHDKPVIVMEPVKGGALANLPEAAARLLREADAAASQASWAIRYAASLDGVLTVLSGMSTLEQMQDNAAFMENFAPLTEAERAVIGRVRAVLAKIPQVPCTDCKYCVADCPQGIAIPGTFKAYNDYLLYGDLARARGDYGWETQGFNGNKASRCVACGLCESVCPQSIGIVEALKKAVEVLEG